MTQRNQYCVIVHHQASRSVTNINTLEFIELFYRQRRICRPRHVHDATHQQSTLCPTPTVPSMDSTGEKKHFFYFIKADHNLQCTACGTEVRNTDSHSVFCRHQKNSLVYCFWLTSPAVSLRAWRPFIIFYGCFYFFFLSLTALSQTSENRHPRNFHTWRGLVPNRTFVPCVPFYVPSRIHLPP